MEAMKRLGTYQGSFGTKATEDDQVYAHFAHSTSAMVFSNVITNAGSDCFSHGTDSLGNFMDVYGARSRGPQKYSTDLQLFMIIGIDYDNDVSSAVTSSVTTATSSVPIATTTATTVSSVVPVTVMNTAATTTTAVPIPVTTISYITSIPNYHNVAMHQHPILNDRLLMFRKLTWIQRVKVQMYEEA